MTKNRTADLHDTGVNVKVVLSGLWISMLFVFAYVDIFGFWRADVLDGALTGEVPGVGFEIDQVFLVLTTIYILIPSLMVIVSLLAPARTNRTANIVVSLVYAATVALSIVGETWVYFILGSVVELVLLLTITRVAWTWSGDSAEPTRTTTTVLPSQGAGPGRPPTGPRPPSDPTTAQDGPAREGAARRP